MTDILCNWLNEEVKLTRKVDASNFAREFSSGYLVGEVLQKYGLQDDFDKFSQSKTAKSKLGNFTLLEPVLHLLEVPFDTNVARDMMTEKAGVATRLMYQVYISVLRKTKANLTGVAMETMRPAAPVKLEAVESDMYKERLKVLTPRQTDLNLDALKARFHQKQLTMEKTAFKERFEEEERRLQEVQEHRQSLIEKYRESQAQKSEMLAKIQAATVHIPKPPANRSARALALQREVKKQREAEAMNMDIESFEEKLKRSIPPSKGVGDVSDMDGEPDPLDLIKPASNNEYIDKIRKRLNEDEAARAEREKRRRKVLVDQLKAHDAQEEAHREEMLVNRLIRQSQQERRIAVQLLQARHEKDVVRHNRILREKQYEERRLKEFENALNREAEVARLAKLDYAEQTKRDEELHKEISKARQEAKYTKHYNHCLNILHSIVDYSTKVGEYRELTNKLVPAKVMRDWTELFVHGQSLYESSPVDEVETEALNTAKVLEEERQALLDEADFTEYRNMVGEWVPGTGSKITGPPRNNPIVGHIVKRLYNIVHPPTPPPPPPEFPPFPIKACVLGKVFGGKSSCVKQLAENHRLTILSPDQLVAEAVDAHKNGETTDAPGEEDDSPDMDDTEEIDLPPKTAGSERSADEDVSERSSRSGHSRSSKLSKTRTAKSGRASKASSKNSRLTVSQATGKTKRSARQSSKKSSKATGDKTPVPPASTEPDNRTLEEASKDDGMEKGDPEKPVAEDSSLSLPADKSVTPSTRLTTPASRASSRPRSRPAAPKASARAKLGAKAFKFLKRGKPVDDQLNVDIIIEAIRRLPAEMGWILDGFPSTYQQAKLLEKALTGMDSGDKKTTKSRKSQLAPDPRPTPPPPEPGSGINVVILFDINNDVCLRRSAGRTAAMMADQQYHQEFNPPPEGSATGVGKQEMVVPVEDTAHDQDQIQHRLTNFQDQWSKLEKWFTKFGTLRTVDASQEMRSVYLEVEKILEDTLRKLRGEDVEESLPVETTEPKEEEEKPAEPEKAPEPQPEAPKEDESRSRPSSKKGSRAGSAKRSGSRGSGKGSKSPARSPSKPDSGKKSAKGSRASSVKRGRSGKKGKTPEPEEEPPAEPPSTPLPVPGSDEWDFVDRLITDEMAQILAPQWDTIENHYVNSSKVVFRNIREERENIIRYFYAIRNDFKSYLRRPDSKQEFVVAWQKEYNDIADDLRDDEETRAEIHQRVDDLRERLWSICDERKIDAENERGTIIKQGWLEDHLGLLANHYITLQQGEVDRFQDTIRMMKDYYKTMEGKIPEEQGGDPVRIPLIELPVEAPPAPVIEDRPESGQSVVSGEGGTRPTTPADDLKSSPSKSATPSGKKKKPDPPPEEPPAAAEEGDKRPKIPLVPRRPVSPDTAAAQAAAKGGKPDKGKGGKGNDVPDAPPPPEDPDDRLVYDAYITALTAIERIAGQILAEQAAREAEEEAEKARELEREKEKEKAAAAAKGKGGKPAKGGKKSRSPSPKKGKASPAPTTPPPDLEETEEEKLAKKLNERARIEFFAALEEEAQAAKARLDQIRLVAYSILANLRGKSDEAYADMNDWLGARFLKEMNSIDHMSEVMRNAIETSSHVKEQLVIDQEDFIVDEVVIMPEFEKDLKVLRTPSPVERPPAVEVADTDTFTVDQIMNLYQQFALTAPTGVLSIKAFQETFSDLSALTHGAEQIPDIWMNLSQDKLDAMAQCLSPDGEYIDWRMLILVTAKPWPQPTQTDLLDTLVKFSDMDQIKTGHVTRQQFDRVDLWFSTSKPATPADPNEPYPFDRMAHLKTTFFDVFADHNTEPPQLDYVQMLLYFAASPDAYVGFLRAVSVASSTHMPRLPRKLNKPSRPTSQASLAASTDFEAGVEGGVDDLEEEIPEDAIHAKVPLDALDKVLHHGQSMRGDTHRFSVTADPEDAFSRERLLGVYQDLGSDGSEAVLFSNLMEHPVIQDIVSTLHTYKAADLLSILLNPGPDPTDAQSIKTGE